MILPVKDRATQPYISEREIPAVKAERDRLRDLVRRILPSLRRDIAQCNGPKQAPRLATLLDEARAAIGEGD